MFEKLFNKWASRQQEKEIKNFLTGLASADGSELGLVVASASDWRHNFLALGIDLRYPAICLAKDPTITFQITRTIQDLQKSGQQHKCVGLMVWVHSLRAMSRPELRKYGREIWRELSRGFPHTVESAYGAGEILGMDFQTLGHDEFPDGLTPDPL
ncbi:hypothetical protein [Hyphococcus sp.]|uniref:hypothetical protein n=1 Tax=Hyphococcus sp. TaxID=2038636 RepID=UPI00375007D1